ncbi:hypothetical protein GCM10023097_10380 [Streptomyces collinus]
MASGESYTYMFDSLLLVNAVIAYRVVCPADGWAAPAVPAKVVRPSRAVTEVRRARAALRVLFNARPISA